MGSALGVLRHGAWTREHPAGGAPDGADRHAGRRVLELPAVRAGRHSNVNTTAQTPLDDALARSWRRGYYASVRYTDTMVGRVLDGLRAAGHAEDTVVVFHGDHGWQLGEHGEWCKQTHFELATRVPMIIRVPGATGSSSSWSTCTRRSLRCSGSAQWRRA